MEGIHLRTRKQVLTRHKMCWQLDLGLPSHRKFLWFTRQHLWYLTVIAAPAKTLGFCPNLMFLLSHSVRADHRTVLQNQLHLTTREYFISGHSYRWEEAVLLSQGADGWTATYCIFLSVIGSSNRGQQSSATFLLSPNASVTRVAPSENPDP